MAHLNKVIHLTKTQKLEYLRKTILKSIKQSGGKIVTYSTPYYEKNIFDSLIDDHINFWKTFKSTNKMNLINVAPKPKKEKQIVIYLDDLSDYELQNKVFCYRTEENGGGNSLAVLTKIPYTSNVYGFINMQNLTKFSKYAFEAEYLRAAIMAAGAVRKLRMFNSIEEMMQAWLNKEF